MCSWCVFCVHEWEFVIVDSRLRQSLSTEDQAADIYVLKFKL